MDEDCFSTRNGVECMFLKNYLVKKHCFNKNHIVREERATLLNYENSHDQEPLSFHSGSSESPIPESAKTRVVVQMGGLLRSKRATGTREAHDAT